MSKQSLLENNMPHLNNNNINTFNVPSVCSRFKKVLVQRILEKEFDIFINQMNDKPMTVSGLKMLQLRTVVVVMLKYWTDRTY